MSLEQLALKILEKSPYLGAFFGGLVSFLSPCVLPLIPSYVAYITGLSFGDISSEHTDGKVRMKIFFHSLSFVIGFTLIFVLLFGASVSLLGSYLSDYINTSIISKIGGILVILFGLHLIGILPISWILGEKRINIKNKPAGYIGSLLVGVAFAAGWTPCIGPVLVTISGYGSTKGVYEATYLLLMYSLGLGVPFILASLSIHSFMIFFNKFKKYIRLSEIVTGVLLILVGIVIFTNSLSKFSNYTNMLFIKN